MHAPNRRPLRDRFSLDTGRGLGWLSPGIVTRRSKPGRAGLYRHTREIPLRHRLHSSKRPGIASFKVNCLGGLHWKNLRRPIRHTCSPKGVFSKTPFSFFSCGSHVRFLFLLHFRYVIQHCKQFLSEYGLLSRVRAKGRYPIMFRVAFGVFIKTPMRVGRA